MTTQDQLRQSLPSTSNGPAVSHPRASSARSATAGRREFTALVASGVAISAWALFPSTAPSGQYVPLPETPARSAANVYTATKDAGGSSDSAYRLINANQEPTPKQTTFEAAAARYSTSGVQVRQVPLRSKLEALLLFMHSRAGAEDWPVLEAKLQALLKLPDSVLAQLMQHPELADLRKALDAVFLGTADVSIVLDELDRIEVTSVPSESEVIEVIKVTGGPTLVVRTPRGPKGVKNVPGSPASAAPQSGPVTVTVVSEVQAPESFTASSFSLLPSSAAPTFAPEPTSEPVAVYSLAPSAEPLPSSPTPTMEIAPSFAAAPEPSAPSTPPEPTPTESSGLSQAPADDVMTSGNKFEPGETVTTSTGGDAPPSQAEVAPSSPVSQEDGPEAGVGDPTPAGGEDNNTSTSSDDQTSS